MTQQIERRRGERRESDEDLPPEYLAVLEVCGGDIRAADRAVLAERRQAQGDAAPLPAEEKNPAAAALPGPDRQGERVPVAADRRRRGTG